MPIDNMNGKRMNLSINFLTGHLDPLVYSGTEFQNVFKRNSIKNMYLCYHFRISVQQKHKIVTTLCVEKVLFFFDQTPNIDLQQINDTDILNLKNCSKMINFTWIGDKTLLSSFEAYASSQQRSNQYTTSSPFKSHAAAWAVDHHAHAEWIILCWAGQSHTAHSGSLYNHE